MITGRARPEKIGMDGRIGKVYNGDQFVNLAMVRGGWAWCYREYTKDQELIKAEGEAKKERVGLWQDGNPVPPWKFRKHERNRKVQQ